MTTRKTFALAYAWNAGSGLVVRGIGILSTLALVRLLTPFDFAVSAAAVLVTGSLAALTQTGGGAYLQIVKEPTRSVINLGSCRHPGSILTVHSVRRVSVKRRGSPPQIAECQSSDARAAPMSSYAVRQTSS